ncbi:MAG: hypothetical protein HY924_11620 [Elusimicrobia bacterium]|nr:hypothetical protein [Elusimicrobiota bacterium]
MESQDCLQESLAPQVSGELPPAAWASEPSLIERVARIEAAVVDSCRKIEDQHLAAAAMRTELEAVDSSLAEAGDKLSTIMSSPLPANPVLREPAAKPAPAPQPEPVRPADIAPPRPELMDAVPPRPEPAEVRPRNAGPSEAAEGPVSPALLLYLAILTAGAVLPWVGGMWASARAARERAAELGAAFPRPSVDARQPEAAAAPVPSAGRPALSALQAPNPLPDDGRERALRLVYAFHPPGRRETVFDMALRSAGPNAVDEVERLDQDSYIVTLRGLRLGPGDAPARFEANLAEGTVSVARDPSSESASTGLGAAPSGR